ncbi:hypothetical protein ACFQL1_01525 [Halomicroarcula sp. GCM10025709]|nr:hypothetical protein [Halomicroarcula sp. YJ-61-S]
MDEVVVVSDTAAGAESELESLEENHRIGSDTEIVVDIRGETR